jgi:alcohol dehydrogenase (cytochrome c)
MIWANRNAFYYVLDRQSGEFLLAKEFVTQTWAAGIDSKGRPIVKPHTSPTPEGTLVRPEGGGATNWWSPSYSPSTGLFYVPVREDSAAIYFKGPVELIPGQMFTGSAAEDVPVETGRGAVRALDPKTGELRWEARLPSDPKTTEMGGLLSTAGNLVFGGNSEQFFALDATTGKMLWKLGGKIVASPVTYLSKGRQQVSIAIGRSIFTLGLD